MIEPVGVAFVSSHAKGGGAERYLELLLGRLADAWVSDVVVLEHGRLGERLLEAGRAHAVIPTSARAPGIVRSAWKLRRRLAQVRPDLVHANGVKAALVSVLATRFGGPPVVWVKHDNTWDGRRARLLARGCRLVIGVSAAVTSTFADGGARVRVVHNGVPPLGKDRGASRRELAAMLGAPAATHVVTLVGRFDPRKGHRELLAAVPTLLERLPELVIAFVGTEDPSLRAYVQELREEVAAAGVEGAVRFLVNVPDAVELIAGSDAVVVASVPDSEGRGQEGFPYAALEAMAVGTPVVAYDQGGLPELLGGCGLLVPPGDREALARELLRLLADEDLRRRLRECGVERVTDRFSLDRTVEAMQECYATAAEM